MADVLRRHIERLEREADRLEKLVDQLNLRLKLLENQQRDDTKQIVTLLYRKGAIK